MGTWSAAIKGNDTFLDVYGYFFNLYNQGEEPDSITQKALKDFEDMIVDEIDEDCYEFYYAIALAQWETKSLDSFFYNRVKEIIESGKDMYLQEAFPKQAKQRQKVLEKFLAKISTEKNKPKRRIKPKVAISHHPFLTAVSPDSQKTFVISQIFSERYPSHIIGVMNWGSGGSSVFHFTEIGRYITAKWIDNQTLEITHDKTIQFQVKQETSFFNGDTITIIYREIK